MRIRSAIILLWLLPALCSAQGAIGSWTDHLSYSSSFCVAAGDGKIFSSAGNAILIRDLRRGVTEKLTRINGLTETEIATIAWSDGEECLVTAYASTNIDIIKNNEVINIPDIKRKYIPGLKEINRIRTNGTNALLASSFGIVVLDLHNYVITDTWKPGPGSDANEVFDIAIHSGIIYAATSAGVYYAPIDRTGLSYFENWDKYDALPDQAYGYNTITAFNGFVYTGCTDIVTGRALFYKLGSDASASLFYSEDNTTAKSLESDATYLTVTTAHAVNIFNTTDTRVRAVTTYTWGSAPDSQHAVTSEGITYIADRSIGLVASSDNTSFSNITLEGPYTNNVADIHSAGGKIFVTGGSVTNSWGNVYRSFQFFSLEDGHWTNAILYGPGDRDAMRVVSDPLDNSHCFVSSWGNGIYEFRDHQLVKNYNQYNSPLSSIISGESYSRICGLAYDGKNNLWMTQSGVSGNLKMLAPDGTWVVTAADLNVPTVGDMLIASNGFIWVVLPRGHGLMVYNPAGTPADINDDIYISLQVETTEGTVLTNIFSIAEDLEGNIWVGTDAGPVVYYTPERAFTQNIRATRIKVPRNDGSGLADFLLHTETITSIAIDGANRKWFGTMSSGAYLVSEDGLTQIQHFTMENSPICSDQIVTVEINGVSGEVWLGTAAGMISYRSDATTGKDDFSGMYAFPNPVREDFSGVVTITGLVENSGVKITDISGNLVFEATSKGGQVTWDMTGYRGKRVATGVYLVFAANSDGTLSGVTKILIIR